MHIDKECRLLIHKHDLLQIYIANMIVSKKLAPTISTRTRHKF